MNLINVIYGDWIGSEVVLGISELGQCYEWKWEVHELQNGSVFIGQDGLFNGFWNGAQVGNIGHGISKKVSGCTDFFY